MSKTLHSVHISVYSFKEYCLNNKYSFLKCAKVYLYFRRVWWHSLCTRLNNPSYFTSGFCLYAGRMKIHNEQWNHENHLYVVWIERVTGAEMRRDSWPLSERDVFLSRLLWCVGERQLHPSACGPNYRPKSGKISPVQTLNMAQHMIRHHDFSLIYVCMHQKDWNVLI